MKLLSAYICVIVGAFFSGTRAEQAVVKKSQTRGYIEIDGSDPFNIPKHSEYVKGPPPDTFDDLRSAPKRNETFTGSDDYSSENGDDAHDAEENSEKKEEGDNGGAISRDVVSDRGDASPKDVMDGLLNEDINPKEEDPSAASTSSSSSASATAAASSSTSSSFKSEIGEAGGAVVDGRRGEGEERGGGGGKQDPFSLLSSNDIEYLDNTKNIQGLLQGNKMRLGGGGDSQEGEEGN